MTRIRPTVAVINTGVVTDSEGLLATSALQKQMNLHFAPAYGRSANLLFVEQGGIPPIDSWWIVLLENSDEAGALGYHDITSDNLPLSKVFVGEDEKYGLSWTVTASHELTEMLADPYINLCAQDPYKGTIYAFEVADACEADEHGYEIDGVLVSDFVLPRWFEPGVPGPYDYKQHIGAPLSLLPGGYISVWDPNRGWMMLEHRQKATGRSTKPPKGSRRERRMRGHDNWKISRPA